MYFCYYIPCKTILHSFWLQKQQSSAVDKLSLIFMRKNRSQLSILSTLQNHKFKIVADTFLWAKTLDCFEKLILVHAGTTARNHIIEKVWRSVCKKMQLPSKTPKQGTCDKLLADAVDFPTPDGSKNRLFLICAITGYSLAEVHILATINPNHWWRLIVCTQHVVFLVLNS